ncbi:hypothetical protein MML48_6g00009936 [Holotrichia oblita]|uniref:Uncharacterized protein n=1 Tax=Holotrichia oblita TaxID=644536 RepID=A0ACB9T0H3_HOLOL|nr:hypothetical protein MML48_6g00009936 [Holotrichia oblita]
MRHPVFILIITQKIYLGIWSPGQTGASSPESLQHQRSQDQDKSGESIPPVWTPKSAGSSPSFERKEFRPVNFESPILGRRNKSDGSADSTPIDPPWRSPANSSDIGVALSSSLEKRIPNSYSAPASGFITDFSSPRLPKAQNPTITLLQKARGGHLPKGAAYIDQVDGSLSHQHSLKRDSPPKLAPGEIVYEIKNEYTSESDGERPKRMADLAQRKYPAGIGPTTKDGMPLTLRSEVRDQNQSKWYKRMYDTIHKQKPRYDGRYPYNSGYLSEPEPGAYDSDVSIYDHRIAPLDRRRVQPAVGGGGENYTTSYTMPRSATNRALKESGYESDSTLIFRRRDEANLLSPSEQREAYRTIQKGGDVPLHGLRKPAPERPKVSGDKQAKRHETCFTSTADINKSNVKFLRDKITCKLSPVPKRKGEARLRVTKTLTASPDLKSKLTTSLSALKDPKTSTSRIYSKTNISSESERCCLTRSNSMGSVRKICRSCSSTSSTRKPTSRAEPVKSRATSLDRTFGSEKRKIDLATSDKRLIKSPELVSPTEVKKASVLTPKSTTKHSRAVLASVRNGLRSPSRSYDIPIKVSISEKGKELLQNMGAKSLRTRSDSASPAPSQASDKSKLSRSTTSLDSVKISKTKKVDKSASLRKSYSTKSVNLKPTVSKENICLLKKAKKDKLNDEIVKKEKKQPKSKSKEAGVKCAGKAAGSELVKKMRNLDFEDSTRTPITLTEIKRQKRVWRRIIFFKIYS